MRERENKVAVISFGITPTQLRDVEELAAAEGLATASFARRAMLRDVTARNSSNADVDDARA